MKKFLLLLCLGSVIGAPVLLRGQAPAGVPGARTNRQAALTKPRIAPLADADLKGESKTLLATYGKSGGENAVRTLLTDPLVVKDLMPFVHYLSVESTLPARQREILILRTAWLCQSPYVWGHHVAAGKAAGLTDAEIRRVAEGADAKGWDAFEANLIRSADQLHRNGFVNTPVWQALSAKHDTLGVMDAVFTVTGFIMFADMYNTLGVQLEPGFTAKLPTDVPYKVTVPAREPWPSIARIAPVVLPEASPDVALMLDPQGRGTSPNTMFRTVARHAKLYPPRQLISDRFRMHPTLANKYQELLIVRTGWLSGAEYQYAQHVRQAREEGYETKKIQSGPAAAGFDPIATALIKATDELHSDDIIFDDTYKTLAANFKAAEIFDILMTVGAYRLIGDATSTFGVQFEPGAERFSSPPPAPAAAAAQAQGGAGRGGGPPQPDFNTVVVKVDKISDNFHTLDSGIAPGKAGVLSGPDGILVVDSQYPELADKFIAAIKSISSAPIRYLVNTHIHPDHLGGNEALGKMGVTIFGSEALRTRMARPQGGRGGAPPTMRPAISLPLVTYEGNVTLHLNGEDVRLILVPFSHTDGDTMVKLVKNDVIMTGDFYRSIEYPFIDLNNGGSLKGIIAAYENLINECGPNTKVIPGHGPVVGRAAVQQHHDMVVAVRDKLMPLVAKGMTVEEILATNPLAEFDGAINAAGTPPDLTKSTGIRFVTGVVTEIKNGRGK